MKEKFYLCSHTHWDREWYGEFQQFRMRLVRMTDDLLSLLEENPDYKCFNFDGQTIVLDDYLEIRPEKEALLRRLIQEGRLVIGPWYILPDEFLVTGESTVRNLLFGEKAIAKFGKVSNVGYLPDTFGHFGQIPQLIKQWGMDVAMLWRGISGEEYKNELTWRSPDGSSVLLYRLIEKHGYCSGCLLVNSAPEDIRQSRLAAGGTDVDIMQGEDAADTLIELGERIAKNSVDNCHMIPNGVDHIQANHDIPNIIKIVNEKLGDTSMVHASFDEFAAALKEAVKGKDLQVVEGELRDTIWKETGWGFILNGVLSSRIYLKQENQECCTLLEDWVEPFSSFHSMVGGTYERGFINKAWEWVLKNHPHDSIGGCSIDPVHRQMETRFEWGKDISENLLQFIFSDMLENVKIEGLEDGEYAFAVFNPSQEKRSGWFETEIEVPWPQSPNLPAQGYRGVIVRDMAGNEQKAWLKASSGDKVVNRPSLRVVATAIKRPVLTISMWAEDVPACGYKVYRFKPIEKPYYKTGDLSPERNVLDNEYLRAEIYGNGTISLTDKTTGETFDGLHYFEDGGDNGGGYAYSFLTDDEVYTSLSSNAEIAQVENSEARAAYKVTITMNLPEALDASNQKRTAAKKPFVIESIISLGAGAKRLDIKTTVVNNIADHRLRVLFPSYLDADISSAEAQFDVVDHPVYIKQPSVETWKEDQPKQFAQKSFVSISDSQVGLAVANIGLPEYEITPDVERSIAVTLLRANGYLSTDWKNTRIGEAGPMVETPEAQMLGRKLVFEYSIIPHAGKWDESGVQQEAHAFAAGMKVFPMLYSKGSAGSLPTEMSFMSASGKNISCSTVKGCEDGDGYAVRIWNSGTSDSTAAISFFKKPAKVYISDIRERRLKEIASAEPIEVSVPAKGILTLRVEL